MFSLGKRNTLGIVLLFTFFTLILSSCAPRHDDSASENEAKDNDVDNNAMLPPSIKLIYLSNTLVFSIFHKHHIVDTPH